MSTRHTSSARSVGPSCSAQSAAETSAFFYLSEYSYSDVDSCKTISKLTPDVYEVEECPLTRHRRVLKEEKVHEAMLDEIRKELKIGKYSNVLKTDQFAPKVEETPSVEVVDVEVVEEKKEKPYENLPKYINAPVKKAKTACFTLSREHSKERQQVLVSNELQKSKSIYLNRIKTNIENKAQEEFRIRKNMRVPRLMTKLRTARTNAFGSVYNNQASPALRAHSMIDGRNMKRTKSKVSTIPRYQLQASCSSFNTVTVPESMKNRIQKNKSVLAERAKLLKAMQ